jgi:uncharacterized oxidoreductase
MASAEANVGSMSGNLLRFNPEEMLALAASLFRACGASERNASLVAEHLVESDLCGVRTHGVMRIPQYLDEIKRGEIDPGAAPVREKRQGGRVCVEGNRAFGQVAGAFALAEAVTAASEHGVAVVTVRHAGHAGRVGAYTEAIARADYISLALCSGPRSGHFVAPFGGIEGRLATNPISYAFPTKDGPVVADFSTSTAPEGEIRLLRDQGLQTPPGVLQTSTGAATTDPNVLYANPPGTIQPLGGRQRGHKGSALGLLVEVMATLLAGDDPDDSSRYGNNLALVAVQAGPMFEERATRLSDYVRSSRPADPTRPVLMPGDRERQAREAAKDVVVEERTWRAISALAERHTIVVPRASPSRRVSPHLGDPLPRALGGWS